MSVSLAKLSWDIPILFKLTLINFKDSSTDNFVNKDDILSKSSNFKSLLFDNNIFCNIYYIITWI